MRTMTGITTLFSGGFDEHLHTGNEDDGDDNHDVVVSALVY